MFYSDDERFSGKVLETLLGGFSRVHLRTLLKFFKGELFLLEHLPEEHRYVAKVPAVMAWRNGEGAPAFPAALKLQPGDWLVQVGTDYKVMTNADFAKNFRS